MAKGMWTLLVSAGLIATGLALAPTGARAQDPYQGPGPTMTVQALQIAHLEAQLAQCREHHTAAYEAAWRYYHELVLCQDRLALCEVQEGPTPAPEPVLRAPGGE